MSYTHLGPMSAFMVDPDTGAEIRYAQVVVETVVDSLTYGIALSCNAELSDNPEAYPEELAALWKLGEAAVDDLVVQQQQGEPLVGRDDEKLFRRRAGLNLDEPA